jgi:hypothetical protein
MDRPLMIHQEEGSMPARDYSVAPVMRLYELSDSSPLSDISAHRRLRYQNQIDSAVQLPAHSASSALSDSANPSVSDHSSSPPLHVNVWG